MSTRDWVDDEIEAAAYWTPDEVRAFETALENFKATGRISQPAPNRLHGAYINEFGEAV